MKVRVFFRKFLVDFLAGLFIVLIFLQSPISSGELAAAEGFSTTDSYTGETFPYSKIFKISAYYSPLPCQKRYATGSYEADIRLNGRGVRGADGTPVYPGMVAAPKVYPFGTKMHIPGIGIVAVHDRGGAIVAANGSPGSYDRLDIWMGYGDKGLDRALRWGVRNVDVTVYGLNNNISEQISLEGYDSSESVADCSIAPTTTENSSSVKPKPSEPVLSPTVKVENQKSTVNLMTDDLKKGDRGERVVALQKELHSLNYYRGDFHGVYDDVTEHAVFKFQQSQGLVGDKSSLGAGIFGPKTRGRVNQILSSRDYTNSLIVRGRTCDKGQ